MDYDQAQKKVKELKKFYRHLTWFGIVTAFLCFNNIFEYEEFDFTFFNGAVLLAVWAVILIVRAVKLFIFNSEWESKILEEELKKAKKTITF
ncbi:hypothetical protein M2347_001361 [Chryseobacterium sp. H1D6B]|uniref:2TM domain-containing protein n=1 Tax=Chryseobacterium sp. H1D6B TaxID=2940588 RepID=UPI0015C8E237|nr:2TM domain-containing protein [Chryseobacterium sp. H1D6B]MDH6251634.1 hypothetical protein [Chryseobacterium sp. H1D6B]